MLPYFFLTNNIGAPHDNTIGLKNFFSNKSSNCFFKSLNYDVDILYGAINTDLVPSTKSMENYISHSGGISLIS